MRSVREIAQSIVAVTEDRKHLSQEAARHYFRFAILDYADALKRAAERSPEMNEIALEKAYIFAARAVQAGANEEELEKALSNLRQYWLPRLVRSMCGLNSKRDRIASGEDAKIDIRA